MHRLHTNQTQEQGPGEDVAAEAAHEISGADVPSTALEVAVWVTAGEDDEHEKRSEGGHDEVEHEARVRLEAERTGGNAEER